jgi:hypothetical protein
LEFNCAKRVVEEAMNREDHSCQRKVKMSKRIWSNPHLLVFGDVRELTRNIGQKGIGDLAYEGKNCKSAGNCS